MKNRSNPSCSNPFSDLCYVCEWREAAKQAIPVTHDSMVTLANCVFEQIVNPKGEMKGSAITGPVGKEAAELWPV